MKKLIGFVIVICMCSCGDSSEKEDSGLVRKETKNSAFENTESDLGSKTKAEDDAFVQKDTLAIKLTPFVAQVDGIGETGSKLLKDRLNSAITKIGFGGEGANPRFIIGPSISLLSKNVTSTAPPKYANTYEINFLVVDVVSETIFATYRSEFKGVGDSPEKAFISGIRNIKYENQGFMDFLVQAERKIIDYFNSNCNTLLNEANAEAKMRNYEVAFSIVKSIPSEAADCFNQVQEKKMEFFQMNLNEQCNEILAKMKAELGKFNDPSASGFNAEAMSYYSMIDKQSECYDEAQKTYQDYISKLKPETKRDWDLKMRQYEDEIAMVKADKEFTREEAKQAYDYKVKLAELESKTAIEGNKKLLEKYKYDESPWLIKVFSKGMSVITGEEKY